MFSVPSSQVGGAVNFDSCSRFSTGDPGTFGPNLWYTLHTLAQNFSDTPDISAQMGCKQFVESVPYMLPSKQSGQLLQSIQLNYPLSLGEICASGYELRYFLCTAHNEINTMLGKPIFSCDPMTLQAQYGTANICSNFT
jgi:mitochondrial FAD-linked sulfhydryl oxidase